MDHEAFSFAGATGKHGKRHPDPNDYPDPHNHPNPDPDTSPQRHAYDCMDPHPDAPAPHHAHHAHPGAHGYPKTPTDPRPVL